MPAELLVSIVSLLELNLCPKSNNFAIAGKPINIPFNTVMAVFAVFYLVFNSFQFNSSLILVCRYKLVSAALPSLGGPHFARDRHAASVLTEYYQRRT